MANDITLYSDAFWVSPYVFSCFVTLKEKGIPFDLAEVHLEKKEQHAASFRDRSITGKVPALEDRRNGASFVIAESSAIVEYIDDTTPGTTPALPRDPRDRARARQLMAWIRSDLMPLREERSTNTMFYEHKLTAMSDACEAAVAKLLRVCETVIPDGKTSLFEAPWTCADSDLAFMLHRLILNGYPVGGKSRHFADAQWARPSVRAFVEHKRAAYVPY